MNVRSPVAKEFVRARDTSELPAADQGVTPTALRRDLYRLIDHVIATGEPLRVRCGVRSVIIVADPSGPQAFDLTRLPRRDLLLCTPGELVATGFAADWRPYLGD